MKLHVADYNKPALVGQPHLVVALRYGRRLGIANLRSDAYEPGAPVAEHTCRVDRLDGAMPRLARFRRRDRP